MAVEYLANHQPSRLRVVTQALEHIDSCIDLFERNAPLSPFSAACGIALVKGKNFALCSLGLITDGYGQESGVLLRLLVEHIEILNYLDRFPDDAPIALANNLPNAGSRAKRIDGKFKFLRDYLNENSSHGSYSEHSIGHIVNSDGSFNKKPSFGTTTLDTNFRLSALFTIFLLRAAVSCIQHITAEDFDEQAKEFDKIQGRAHDVFQISVAEEA